MGQSWNGDAIKTVLRLLFHKQSPNYFIPHCRVGDISEINFEALKYEHKLEYIVFDKDNTLTWPYEIDFPKDQPHIKAAWNECLRVFGRDRVVILSNSAGSQDDLHYKEAKRIESHLGVSVIRHEQKKPLGFTSLESHFHYPPSFQSLNKPVAIVGDRLMTDVLYGNLNGCYSILVTRVLNESNDNPIARVMRQSEHVLLDWLIKYGYKPLSRKMN